MGHEFREQETRQGTETTMKNKDKYNLLSLKIEASYLTNGCGKKIEGMRYLTIKDGEKVLLSELVNGKPIVRLMQWMEEDG